LEALIAGFTNKFTVVMLRIMAMQLGFAMKDEGALLAVRLVGCSFLEG